VKRCFLCPLIILTVLAGTGLAQAPQKPDVVGTWVGTALSDDTLLEVALVIDKTNEAYSGKFSEATGMVVASPLREIVFKDGKLTFEFDLSQPLTALIKFELLLDNGTLKGVWFDPDGNSGAVELAPKK